MKILVINGPNINMLGLREPDIYGSETYDDLVNKIGLYCQMKGIDHEMFQSNSEGAIVDKIQEVYGRVDGIVINPAAYTHTSIAIPDAVKAVKIPTVEVHISNPDEREEYRKINYIREICVGTVTGHGTDGYLEAIDLLTKHLEK